MSYSYSSIMTHNLRLIIWELFSSLLNFSSWLNFSNWLNSSSWLNLISWFNFSRWLNFICWLNIKQLVDFNSSLSFSNWLNFRNWFNYNSLWKFISWLDFNSWLNFSNWRNFSSRLNSTSGSIFSRYKFTFFFGANAADNKFANIHPSQMLARLVCDCDTDFSLNAMMQKEQTAISFRTMFNFYRLDTLIFHFRFKRSTGSTERDFITMNLERVYIHQKHQVQVFPTKQANHILNVSDQTKQFHLDLENIMN